MTASGAGGAKWDSRRRAREAALQMLYQAEVGQVAIADAARTHGHIGDSDAIDLDDEAREYAIDLARGSWQERTPIEEYIADAARNWRVERMAVIDRLLLRLAVHEMLSQPGTPPRVVIDEAIELARRYSGEDSARFVNGVLDGVFHRLKDEGKIVD